MNVNAVMMVFCQYGFRKASMEDIAKAAGVSRQSIYKKFGSKEKVFEWVIEATMQAALTGALQALSHADNPLAQRMADAFDQWIGSFVSILHSTQHGGEILDRAIDTVSQCGSSHDESFYRALEDLMLEADLVRDRKAAADKAFVLGMASKGVMLKTETGDAFRLDMERIIKTVLID
ncbi:MULTISPECIES: TetR/AcrR family transcriptional regulator [Cohaesibacter]|uniref:TetR/AcrR family transcriptional regulator n=1 Tax=Cohaesibacter TaxID=655352 RepID=UPI000DEA2808|nr:MULTISPECIES: TetR/AcrR family transcriptional regulator [Cohaesibacter]TLP45638.1 TetR/AcrR family transcriptional regulator [Cohaesibacter sp. CAU 1516]